MNASRKPWTPVRAAVVGGLTAGAFDISYAVIFSAFRHVPPMKVLQSVASGLLGPASYQGGVATALLGLLLHFGIACTMAAVYVFASRRIPVLLRNPVPCGIAYGAVLYAVMNYVVLPLSAIHRSPHYVPVVFWSGLAVHMFLIGLPIALFAARTMPES